MIIIFLTIQDLRDYWRTLRLSKPITHFDVDYQLLKKEAHRLLKTLEKKA
ncbi:TPA: hypothetical protein ACNIQM_002110 [Citrobacter werkmanii]